MFFSDIKYLQDTIKKLFKLTDIKQFKCYVMNDVLNLGKQNKVEYPASLTGKCAIRDGEESMLEDGKCTRCKRYITTEVRYYKRKLSNNKPVPVFVNSCNARKVLFEKNPTDIVDIITACINKRLFALSFTIEENVVNYFNDSSSENILFKFDRVNGRLFVNEFNSVVKNDLNDIVNNETLFLNSKKKKKYEEDYILKRSNISRDYLDFTFEELFSALSQELLYEFIEMNGFHSLVSLTKIHPSQLKFNDNRGSSISHDLYSKMFLLGVLYGYEYQVTTNSVDV
jgi:hypothetical protein